METKKNNIVYVDVDQVNQLLFSELIGHDYQVYTTNSTAVAFDLLNQYPVKVLICEQRMPDESGLAFIQRITPEYPSLIKIISSANVEQEVSLQALNQGGVYHYLVKPWSSKELRQIIFSAVREYNLNTENQNLVKQLQNKNRILQNAFFRLQESEQKLNEIFQASSDGIIMISDNSIHEINTAFLSLIGYVGRVTEKPQIIRYIKRKFPDLLALLSQSIIIIKPQAEFELVFENGEKKILELNSRMFENQGVIAILSVVRDVTDRKQTENRIMEAIFKAQEAEKERYARELHDGMGPMLATLKMYVEWLFDPNNTANKEIIGRNAIQSINEAITTAKEIANDLSPHVLQRFGLVNAVQTYIDKRKDVDKINYSINSLNSERFSADQEIMLYRVLIECIHNSLKYAQAKNIMIEFIKQKEKNMIRYSDDGVGFDTSTILTSSKGMGMYNMQKRIKMIGGELSLNSSLGKGVSIEITINLQ